MILVSSCIRKINKVVKRNGTGVKNFLKMVNMNYECSLKERLTGKEDKMLGLTNLELGDVFTVRTCLTIRS